MSFGGAPAAVGTDATACVQQRLHPAGIAGCSRHLLLPPAQLQEISLTVQTGVQHNHLPGPFWLLLSCNACSPSCSKTNEPAEPANHVEVFLCFLAAQVQ